MTQRPVVLVNPVLASLVILSREGVFEGSKRNLSTDFRCVPIQNSRTVFDYELDGAEWLRIAFAQFISSESRNLMGITDLGEYKLYAVDRFKGILHAAVNTSLKTNSPIPEWAAAK
jgi:hypothetical protein